MLTKSLYINDAKSLWRVLLRGDHGGEIPVGWGYLIPLESPKRMTRKTPWKKDKNKSTMTNGLQVCSWKSTSPTEGQPNNARSIKRRHNQPVLYTHTHTHTHTHEQTHRTCGDVLALSRRGGVLLLLLQALPLAALACCQYIILCIQMIKYIINFDIIYCAHYTF